MNPWGCHRCGQRNAAYADNCVRCGQEKDKPIVIGVAAFTGSAKDLDDGFYWYRKEDKFSVCRIGILGVEFVGEEKVFERHTIEGTFWTINPPA